VCSEDAVLGGKTLDLQEQFLIDHPADVRQNASSSMTFHPTLYLLRCTVLNPFYEFVDPTTIDIGYQPHRCENVQSSK
jgi:hypothetical protein